MKANRVVSRTLLVVGGVLLYFGAVFGVWRVGTRDAVHKTEELLDYASGDLSNSWEGFFHGSLDLCAYAAMKSLGDAAPRPTEELRRFVENHAIDELHLVDRNGRIVSSSEAGCPGMCLGSVEGCAELLTLTNASVPFVNLPFRDSFGKPVRQMLYSGFSFRGDSFVVCGISEETLASHLAKTGNDYMSTWQIGESGSFVTIDDRTGRIVFDVWGREDLRGRIADEVGADEPLACGDDTKMTHLGSLLGERCYYRNFHYLGLRFVPFVPVSEFTSGAVRTTLVTAAVLLVVFAVFAFILVTTARMRAARDAQHLKDMNMAKSIQTHSLPTLFPPYPDHVDHFDIFAFMKTAKDVGGDFYDFFFVGQDKLALVIADVSGKGVPAAMFMMRAKITIQSQMRRGLSVAESVAKVNNSLCSGNSDNMFVTAWIGVCDLKTGEMEYVNAGHNPPLIRRADGAFEWVTARSGLVLAAMEGAVYRPKTLRLAPGDEIFLYTDGLTEAQDVHGTLYGENRLEVSARRADAHLDARGFCGQMIADLDGFVKDAEQADDITLLDFRLKSLTAG